MKNFLCCFVIVLMPVCLNAMEVSPRSDSQALKLFCTIISDERFNVDNPSLDNLEPQVLSALHNYLRSYCVSLSSIEVKRNTVEHLKLVAMRMRFAQINFKLRILLKNQHVLDNEGTE